MEFGFSVMSMIFLCHVLCCSLMMSHNRRIVEAAETLKNVEDLEIEQKLKLINKPAVKIIKCIYGERHVCVDFYKQPGFDHPSMKNHTFHYKMRLMSFPEGSKMQIGTVNNKTFGHLWANGIGCPIGMVPMLRVNKEKILRLKSLGGDNSNHHEGSWNNTYEPMSSGSPYHFAVLRTNKQRSYSGASMNIAIHTPSVRHNQISSARLHIQIGNEFIQAGWTVNPQLYGDARSRLFVYTNAGGHQCYHSRCPSGAGMIQVHQDISPGLPLADKYKDIDIAIIKDKANGNWWLLLDASWEQIGFWPSSRFKESFGTRVEWGGAVYSSSLPSPPMGNGHFPTGNPTKDSYIRLITTVDENYKTDNTVKNTKAYSDSSRGYKVRDTTESFWKHAGHIIIYGGPGNI